MNNWQNYGYASVPYGNGTQPANQNWYADGTQGGHPNGSLGDAGNGSGVQSNANTQSQQNNQGAQTSGQTGVQGGSQGQTTQQQNGEESEDSEEEDPPRIIGQYIAQMQYWWYGKRIHTMLTYSALCAYLRGVPWGTPHPASHTRLNSHPSEQCYREHRHWIYQVVGCAAHNGIQDALGVQNPVRPGEWLVPPCEWCRRELDENIPYLSIGYAQKEP